MNCEQVRKKYKDYLLGKLRPEERESVTDHIRDCADCFVMDQKENGLHLEEYPGVKANGKPLR
jgi:hypothetical protein